MSLIFTRADGSTITKKVTETEIPSVGNNIFVPTTSATTENRGLSYNVTSPKSLKVAATIRGADGRDQTCDSSPVSVECTSS